MELILINVKWIFKYQLIKIKKKGKTKLQDGSYHVLMIPIFTFIIYFVPKARGDNN